ncbi:MAG: alpha/beta hydrolase [Clostridia bacterium]|nr:alpha/beta hydrolase [Clostridia bacterium]
MKKNRTFLITGVLCLILSFAMMFVYNIPTMNEQVLTFTSTYKSLDVTLEATYYEKENAEYAVLICPGYSCDRQKWRPFADLYLRNGLSVMSFDYSGQGASTGVIGFDNAKTDNIPMEINDALDFLHQVSGIPYDHIILHGHSMGGRSILRLLSDYNNPEAQTTVEKRDIKNVILLSPEVNYKHNAQASLFAGTNDESEEPWKSFNENFIKGTNVYIFGSTADDVVDDVSILQIYRHIGGKNMPDSGVYYGTETNSVGSKITVGTVKGVLHSYQMYSSKFTKLVSDAVSDITGNEPVNSPTITLIYLSWLFALLGIYMTIKGMNLNYEGNINDTVPEIVNIKKFLLQKLLFWIPGLLIAGILCSVCVVIPFGSPIMNIPYMCFIAGYGIFMLFYYLKKKKKNVKGKLPEFTLRVKIEKKDILPVILLTAGILFFTWYILFGSMYRLVPFNYRMFWLFFNSILMTIGYYISGIETDMLKNASGKERFLYSLIQYVPLFLFTLFYAIIKSYSGFIGQIQNLILLYILCIPLGEFIKRRTHSRLLGALITGFTFQTLMITSAALIAIF